MIVVIKVLFACDHPYHVGFKCSLSYTHVLWGGGYHIMVISFGLVSLVCFAI